MHERASGGREGKGPVQFFPMNKRRALENYPGKFKSCNKTVLGSWSPVREGGFGEGAREVRKDEDRGAIYPAFKPSARGVTPPNDGLGLEDGCGSGNEEKEQDQMSKSIRTWSMREEGRKGEGGAVLERHARVGKEQLSVTTGAFETYGSLLSSFLHYQRSLNSLLLPYIRAFASHIYCMTLRLSEQVCGY